MNPLLQKIVLLSLVFWSDTLWACAVCFGDPESSLTKGAVAGVLVLVGIIMSVLGGMVGMASHAEAGPNDAQAIDLGQFQERLFKEAGA